MLRHTATPATPTTMPNSTSGTPRLLTLYGGANGGCGGASGGAYAMTAREPVGSPKSDVSELMMLANSSTHGGEEADWTIITSARTCTPIALLAVRSLVLLVPSAEASRDVLSGGGTSGPEATVRSTVTMPSWRLPPLPPPPPPKVCMRLMPPAEGEAALAPQAALAVQLPPGDGGEAQS